MGTPDIPHFRPDLRRPPGMVTSLSVVMVHPTREEVDAASTWLQALDTIIAAVSELFVEGGDAAVLGTPLDDEDLVATICQWLWEGGTSIAVPGVVIRRFAARWLFAGLDRTGNPDIEVQARAIGMALRIVVPGQGLINPPAEWTETQASQR